MTETVRSLVISHYKKSGDSALLMGWCGSASCYLVSAFLSVSTSTLRLVFSWSQEAAVALGMTSLCNLIYRQKGRFSYLSFFLNRKKDLFWRQQLTDMVSLARMQSLSTPWVHGTLKLTGFFVLWGTGQQERSVGCVWGCLLGRQPAVSTIVC